MKHTTERTGDNGFQRVGGHSLRHRYAQRRLIDENMSPRVVTQVGGWSSVQTITPCLDAPSEGVVNDDFSGVKRT